MTAGFDPAIGQEFGFDPIDLQFNQSGVLSPPQIEGIRAEHTKSGAQARVVGVVIGVFFLGVCSWAVIGTYSKSGAPLALKLAGFLAVLSVIVVLVYVADWYRRRRGPDLRLYVVEGVIRCREDDDSHAIDIGGRTFFVLSTAFAVLHDGRCYRIYYVEQPFIDAGKLVSAEALL